MRQVDLAVVGAGPAGLMAASTAAGAGITVLVLERESWTGGRLGLQPQALQGPRSIYRGLTGMEFHQRQTEEALSAGVELATRAVVSRLEPTTTTPRTFRLSHATPAGVNEVAARSVVLATGSSEPGATFPGSALAGVMLSGDAQVMTSVRGSAPGRRAVMVGSSDAGLLIAANLLARGVEVAAVVEEAASALGRRQNVALMHEAGVPILTSTRVVSAAGTNAVESVEIVRIDADGRTVPGKERRLEADVICLAGPRVPTSQLATRVGCPLKAVDVLGGPVPVHDRRMATPVPGVYVCGDMAGVESGAVALESGRLAGLLAAEELGRPHPRAASERKLAVARLAYLRRGSRGLLRRAAKRDFASEFASAVPRA